MTYLSELASLVAPDYRPSTAGDQIGEYTLRLFDYLRDSPAPSNGGATEVLALNEQEAIFRKVKHLLKIDLLNAVAAIQPSERYTDKRQRSYAYVWKLIAVGKQLRNSTTSEVLLDVLREAFRKASELEMLDAAFQAASMLRRQYNNRRFDAERYEYYRDQAERYRMLSRSYQDVVADLNEIVYLRNSQAEPKVIRQRAREYHDKNAHLIEQYDVAIISYIVYLTELNAYLADHNYAGVIEVATTALTYLKDRPGALPAMFQVFEANLSVAYTQLNDYPNGMQFARLLLTKTSPTDYNYIKVYELMLLLTLRAGKFQQAYEVFSEISPTTLTHDLRSYYHETFRIIEAYLYLLVEMKEIQVNDQDEAFSRFRIKRFVNSFQHVTHEKSHRNVHLLIIQIVDEIIHQRPSKSIYSIEAITKYAQRHLRGRGHERVRNFLKALAQLSVQSFHRAAVERHTARYIKQLQRFPIAESKHDYYMELIPYDTLWGLILQHLGYKRLRKPSRGRG